MTPTAMKPRARRVSTFRIDDGGLGLVEPVWIVRFNGTRMRFVHPSLDRALASAFAWRIATMPKWHLVS